MPDEFRHDVGFIGTGRMGLPMCQRLLAAGRRVAVHTRTRTRAELLVEAGATWCDSVADVAEAAPNVVTCLDSVEGTERVYLGAEGLVGRVRPGTLLVDHATITPELARRVGDAARMSGADFVDAPVSGGPEGAAQGTLAIMMGGAQEATERARGIVSAYGRTIMRMGDTGAGTHAKLINQLLTFAHGAAAAEAIALAERLSIDLGSMQQLLQQSFGQSRMLDRTLDRVRAGNYDAGAALGLYEKDLGIVESVAAQAGVSTPLVEAMQSLLRRARGAGLHERDIAALRLMYPAE